MGTQPTRDLTYEDLRRMFPEEDMVRREIIDGELLVTPSPGGRHQDAVTELVIELGLYARKHGGRVYPAPRDVYLSERDVVEPDVLFVCAEHIERAEEPYVRGAPDLVIEVSSPGTRRVDLIRKRELYERYGVAEYWFVDLDEHAILVFALDEGAYREPARFRRGETVRSIALPGFQVAAGGILGAPAPA